MNKLRRIYPENRHHPALAIMHHPAGTNEERIFLQLAANLPIRGSVIPDCLVDPRQPPTSRMIACSFEVAIMTDSASGVLSPRLCVYSEICGEP